MSQIPAPPVLPKPKNLSKGNDAASAEHDALFRLVWRNLDGIVKFLYGQAAAKATSSAPGKVDGYLRSCAKAAELAQKLAQEFGTDRRAADAQALAGRLLAVKKSFVPPLTAEMQEPTIVHRVLTAPISEHKTVAGQTRVTQVGFVDIACTVNIPKDLNLRSNLPSFVKPDDMHSVFRRPAEDIAAKNLREAPAVPYWSVESNRFSFWVDVRVKPLPLGQLMRELKTLRAYARQECDVCVVMPSFDDETLSFLRDENFIPLNLQFLNKHGFV